MHGVPPRLVVGDAGIGKSRLVHGCARPCGHRATRSRIADASRSGRIMRCFRSCGSSARIGNSTPTVRPTSRTRRSTRCSRRSNAIVRRPVSRLRPALGLPCDAKAARWPGAREQDALFDVLEQLIVSLGNGAPVLLVVDDVQWIDRSTEDFSGVPAALVARGGALHRSRRDRQARALGGMTERLVLRRLPRDDARRLMSAHGGALDPAGSTLSIVRRAFRCSSRPLRAS